MASEQIEAEFLQPETSLPTTEKTLEMNRSAIIVMIQGFAFPNQCFSALLELPQDFQKHPNWTDPSHASRLLQN